MQYITSIGRWALALLMLAAAAPALTPQAVQARSDAWAQAQVVSQTDIATYEPRLAYDPEGFAHAVYFAGRTQSEWSVYYTNNRSGAWAAPRKLSDNEKIEQRAPDIAIGRDGHIHVVYEKRTRTPQVFYVESPDLGKTWAAPINISNTSTRAYEPTVAVDANNSVHAAWIDSRWASILQTTYSAKLAGGAFSAPIKVGGNTFEQGPDIATTGAGANTLVHIVYQGRRAGSNSTKDFDVYLVHGANGQFNQPINFSKDGDWSLEPTIASDGLNSLMIAWDKDDNYHDVVTRVSLNRGASWSELRNVYSRSTPGLTPKLGYGNSKGQGHFHLAWSEGESGRRIVLYLAYNPATNQWGNEIEQASESGTLSVAVASSLVTNETIVAYRNKGLDSTVSTRGTGAFIGAGIEIVGYTGPTREDTFKVKLLDPQGDPVEMRSFFDGDPGELFAPWVPFASEFDLTAPDVLACDRVFSIQFRTADKRTSPLFTRDLVIDDEVQAQVTVANPLLATLGGHGGYSKDGQVRVEVKNRGECSGFSALAIDGQPFPIGTDGFSQTVTLSGLGVKEEGQRPIRVELADALGNQLELSKTIVVDRTPPKLLSGTLTVETREGTEVPTRGLSSVLSTLRFSNLVISDSIYPDGYWGALIANVPASDSPSAREDSGSALLTWLPARLTRQPDGTLTVKDWEVLEGLVSSVDDRSLAGDEIEVRVRFIDGAGNIASTTLSDTVRLAPDYRARELALPLAKSSGP
jgi:hypothetical protein